MDDNISDGVYGQKGKACLIFRYKYNLLFSCKVISDIIIDKKYILALSINLINYIVLLCSAYSEGLCSFMTP